MEASPVRLMIPIGRPLIKAVPKLGCPLRGLGGLLAGIFQAAQRG